MDHSSLAPVVSMPLLASKLAPQGLFWQCLCMAASERNCIHGDDTRTCHFVIRKQRRGPISLFPPPTSSLPSLHLPPPPSSLLPSPPQAAAGAAGAGRPPPGGARGARAEQGARAVRGGSGRWVGAASGERQGPARYYVSNQPGIVRAHCAPG